MSDARRPLGRRGAAIAAREAQSPETLGGRLHALRTQRGLTITQLAEIAGVPGSTISKIERGRLGPSLVNAIRLARALGENLGFLTGKYRDPIESLVIVRAAQRQSIDYEEIGLLLQDLSGHFTPGLLEARIGILAPGATSGGDPMTHAGEEFCYVLAGSIRYLIGVEEITLGAGEYIQCKSDTRHSWMNVARGETRVLWVFSDGLSF
ncbi:MAG: XRE family transcriptional regulator [Burkholderiaceae bacterium]|nr:XRE family transcriptional regulator [Burkholderiaceae bacterium]